jgi:CheY-like chemotaxis protein/HPt (histidine-containing phosphotransfer) domain-containing protein
VLFGKDVHEQRVCKLAEEIHADPGISGVNLLTLKSGQQLCEAAGVRAISASTSRDLADALAASVLHPQAEVPCNLRPALRPMRVLLAEDNPVNQKLAVRLLESAGHSVTVAGNGRAALECFQASEFDLILMDVQMPGISGLECAARVRELERPTGKRIPILAITAHAMKGAQEQCIAAGMDGYLAKPFRSHELFRAIAELAVPTAQPSKMTSSQWDHALMEELSAIFQETKPRMILEIESAIAAEDPEALRAAAHTLRGSLSVFDAPAGSALALRLERLAETGTTKGATSILKRLVHEISAVGEVAARASAAGN